MLLYASVAMNQAWSSVLRVLMRQMSLQRLPANCMIKHGLLLMETGHFFSVKKGFLSERSRPGSVNQDAQVLFPAPDLRLLLGCIKANHPYYFKWQDWGEKKLYKTLPY